MIAVAIAAVLAAVAMPAYQSFVRKGNRADATSLLQAASLAQEKHRLGNPAYTANTTDLTPACPTSGSCKSAREHYTLTVDGASATAYTLTATAASSLQLGDTGCTEIVLSVSGGTTSHTPAECWSK